MEKFIAILQENGFKLTNPRRKVLDVLTSFPIPMTITDLHSKCSGIDFTSAYRCIKLFNEIGIVEEVSIGDKQLRYELNNRDHHHHIMCTKCSKIQRIDLCVLEKVKSITNYKITNHSIEFMGICPECQKKK